MYTLCIFFYILFFQDLNVNFRTIILPEALKIIQSQEPSVFSILSQLETILSETGYPLDTITSQLEMLHRNAVMGLKVMVLTYILTSQWGKALGLSGKKVYLILSNNNILILHLLFPCKSIGFLIQMLLVRISGKVLFSMTIDLGY